MAAPSTANSRRACSRGSASITATLCQPSSPPLSSAGTLASLLAPSCAGASGDERVRLGRRRVRADDAVSGGCLSSRVPEPLSADTVDAAGGAGRGGHLAGAPGPAVRLPGHGRPGRRVPFPGRGSGCGSPGDCATGTSSSGCPGSEHEGSLTPLHKVVSPEPVLTPEIAALIRRVADHYASCFADVLRLAVPPRHAATEKAAAGPPAAPVDVERGWCRVPSAPTRTGRSSCGRWPTGHSPRAYWQLIPSHDPSGDWATGLAVGGSRHRRRRPRRGARGARPARSVPAGRRPVEHALGPSRIRHPDRRARVRRPATAPSSGRCAGRCGW